MHDIINTVNQNALSGKHVLIIFYRENITRDAAHISFFVLCSKLRNNLVSIVYTLNVGNQQLDNRGQTNQIGQGGMW